MPFKVFAEGIALNRTQINAKLSEGELTLMATVTPSAASQKVKWSSSNEKVATVNGGVVRLLAAGTTVISCETTDGTGFKAQCSINVADEPVLPPSR